MKLQKGRKTKPQNKIIVVNNKINVFWFIFSFFIYPSGIITVLESLKTPWYDRRMEGGKNYLSLSVFMYFISFIH